AKKQRAQERSKRKAPLGQGRSARSERKKRAKAQQELQAQLGELHTAQKRKLQQAGASTDKSTGYAKALQADASQVNEDLLPPLKRCFWPETVPEGEPDDALKMKRKSLGIKVRGSPIPPPVETLSDSLLPPAFGLFFKGARGGKLVKPTPIQMQVWPAALSGVDVLGIAPTGSGKTLAYLLPAAIHIAGQAGQRKDNQSPSCLVLLPTRELASQVGDHFKGKGSLRQVLGLRGDAIYGGVGKEVQVDSILTSGCPEVLSATPGRLLDLMGLGALSLGNVSFLVLDEADKMLQLGFEDQLDAIAKGIRRDRQCLLFSATFPLRLRQAGDRWLTCKDKVVVRVGSVDIGGAEEEDGTAPGDTATPKADKAESRTSDLASTLTVSKSIEQIVHVCADHKKFRKLIRFMDKIRQEEKEQGVRQRALVIVFCNTIKTLKAVASFLGKHKHPCAPLHSGIPQVKREKALREFKAGSLQLLVATDVAARGLHVKHLRYVINYDFPPNLEQYCHRIGRTGRDGESGTAFSFFTRNLSPLSRDLITLLERSGQKVDQHLRALAEGKAAPTAGSDDEESMEATAEHSAAQVVEEPAADDGSEDHNDYDPFASVGGGLRIAPRKRREVSSSEEDEDPPQEAQEEKPDSEPPAGSSSRPKQPKHKDSKKVKRLRGKRGGAKHRTS
ncbi:ddx17, partial [Symbiodinium pilosum]